MNTLKANKFKVGDEVKIVSLQGTDGIGCRGDCNVWIGETGRVTEVGVGDMPYAVETNDEVWCWSGNNLKLVNEETSTSQNESIKETIELQPIPSVPCKLTILTSSPTLNLFAFKVFIQPLLEILKHKGVTRNYHYRPVREFGSTRMTFLYLLQRPK